MSANNEGGGGFRANPAVFKHVLIAVELSPPYRVRSFYVVKTVRNNCPKEQVVYFVNTGTSRRIESSSYVFLLLPYGKFRCFSRITWSSCISFVRCLNVNLPLTNVRKMFPSELVLTEPDRYVSGIKTRFFRSAGVANSLFFTTA